MVDYPRPTGFASSYFELVGDEGANFSADESGASTLSVPNDGSSSSDIMASFLHTMQTASPTNFHEENEANRTSFGNDERRPIDLESLAPSSVFHDLGSKQARLFDVSYKPLDETVHAGNVNSDFITDDCLLDTISPRNRLMPVKADNATPSKTRTHSPGMSKMLLSLSDHPLERPCTPNASSLYRNTKTYCNPSELGKYTYDECMFFTQWANKFLQYSQDHVTITDLARDLGDGLTLLTMVELLTGKYPPQIHIKPALNVQKMENIQACLDFLEQTGVSVNGITAEDIVQGNLKVVLALCHCLHRIFSAKLYPGPIPLSEKTLEDFSTLHQSNSVSSAVSDLPVNTSVSLQLDQSAPHKPLVYHTVDKNDWWLFNWVAKLTGQQITDLSSFQDGTVLCLLLNKITGDVIPNLVLNFGSPAEKISLALKVSSEELAIDLDLQPDDVLKQRNHSKFITYLESLYLLYSKKLKRIHEAFERSNLARERKREKLRKQRLKEHANSQCMYLERLSPNISQVDGKWRQLPSEVSPTIPISSCENLTKTKDQLEELKKELKLLELECSDYFSEGGLESRLSSPVPAMLVGLPERGKQMRSRQVLREIDHDSQNKIRKKTNSGHLKESRLFLVEGSDERTSGAESNGERLTFGGCYLGESNLTSRNGLPFGGCYLSESNLTSRNGLSFGGCYLSESYNSSSERDLNPSTGQPSSLKALMRNERTSDTGNVTLPSYGSSLAINDWTHRAEDGNGVSPLKPSTFRKGTYSGCEVVEPEDVKGRTASSISRMLDAGNLSKLGNNSRFSSDVLFSTGPGNVNLGIETSTAMLPKSRYYSNEQALGEGRSKSLKNFFSSNQAEKDTLRLPLQLGLSESHVQRQRNSSEDLKRFREQTKATKSGRRVEQGPSVKTHLQALTALARMSSKKASALCGEGATLVHSK